MKRISAFLIILTFMFMFCGCGAQETLNSENQYQSDRTDSANTQENEEMKINILINGLSLSASLENNETGKSFYKIIGEGITLELAEYGGFEKVGSLGKQLPRDDKRITTKSGDLILYQGSEFSIMYGSNTWSYTKIGAIDDVDKINLKTVLGNGDVIINITK